MKMCKQLDLPKGKQHGIIQIDVYTVHTCKEFRDWLKNKHPYLHLVYIPAGCTGVAQVADTVLNR